MGGCGIKCKLQNLTLILTLHPPLILLIPSINMYTSRYTYLLISKMVICYGNINISESLTYNPPNLFLSPLLLLFSHQFLFLSSYSFLAFCLYSFMCTYTSHRHHHHHQSTDSIFIVVHVVK